MRIKIERIDVRNYFLLKDIHITPGDFCVIHGDNESGKTMLLDAILDALFHIRTRKREFGSLFPRLFNRYTAAEEWTDSQGPDVSILLSENGQKKVYPSDELLSERFAIEGLHLRNLLVVREGEVEFIQRDSRQWDKWWDLLRQHLSGVEGGLHRMKEKVADIAGITPKDGDWVNREGRRLKDEVRSIEEELYFIDEHSEEVFELEQLRSKFKELSEEEKKVSAELERMRRLKKKEVYRRAVREMEVLNRLRQDEKKFGLLNKRDFDLWRDIEARIVSLTNELNRLMKQYQAQEKELKRKEDMATKLRMEAAEWERREVEIVPEIEKRLQKLRTFYTRKQALYRWQPLVLSAFFASCGIAVLFFVLSFVRSLTHIVGTVAAAATAVLSYIFWLRMRSVLKRADAAKREVFSFFEQMGETATDIEEAERWLEVSRSTARESRAKAELLFMEVERERGQFEQLTDSMASKKVLLEEVRGELDTLRRKTGVATFKELQEQFEMLAQIQGKMEAQKRLLSELLGTEDETDFYHRIAQLKEFAETEGEYDEALHRELEERLPRIRQEKDEKGRRVAELERRFASYGLSVLEDVWARKEELRRRLRKFQTDKSAALLAIKIIDELAESQDSLINSIMDGGADSTGAIFSELTDGAYNAALWKDREIYVESANGTTFHADMLSSGTKVQLYFAMRMALLHRLFEGNKAFLLLDDPFLPCDAKRLQTLLTTLLTLSKSGWQVLYLTVDRDIVDWALEHQNDGVRLHHLRSLPL